MTFFTENQLRDIAIYAAHVAHSRDVATTEDYKTWCDAQLYASRKLICTMTEGEYTLNTIKIDPRFYRNSFPGVKNVDLDYQVNVVFYRSNEWGNDYLFAGVEVGRSTDGYTYTDVQFF